MNPLLNYYKLQSQHREVKIKLIFFFTFKTYLSCKLITVIGLGFIDLSELVYLT